MAASRTSSCPSTSILIRSTPSSSRRTSMAGTSRTVLTSRVMRVGSSVSKDRKATVGVAAWSAGTCRAVAVTAGSATAAASMTSTEVTPFRARWVRQIPTETGWGSTATYRTPGAARAPCTAK